VIREGWNVYVRAGRAVVSLAIKSVFGGCWCERVMED